MCVKRKYFIKKMHLKRMKIKFLCVFLNFSTYMDSKSPGLTGRIVQYTNERKEERMPTHQAKYGSPGLFPVVHFFKQSVPVISPKPRRVTVRIATPGEYILNLGIFCSICSFL